MQQKNVPNIENVVKDECKQRSEWCLVTFFIIICEMIIFITNWVVKRELPQFP